MINQNADTDTNGINTLIVERPEKKSFDGNGAQAFTIINFTLQKSKADRDEHLDALNILTPIETCCSSLITKILSTLSNFSALLYFKFRELEVENNVV